MFTALPMACTMIDNEHVALLALQAHVMLSVHDLVEAVESLMARHHDHT